MRPLLILTLLLAGVVLVGSLPMPPSQSALAQYKQLYHAYLQPLNLYQDRPNTYAPVHSLSAGRFNPAYMDLLDSDHPAYIGPSAADRLTPVLLRITDLASRGEQRPPSVQEQRGLLMLLVEEATRAKQELQIPLHPVNVAAQHTMPLSLLLENNSSILGYLQNPTHLERLTGLLSVEDQIRFLDAQEVLDAEKRLLQVAIDRYAARIPQL